MLVQANITSTTSELTFDSNKEGTSKYQEEIMQRFKEIFDEYSEPISNLHSSHSTFHTCKGIKHQNFLKHLKYFHYYIADKVFYAFDSGKKGYLSEEDYVLNLYKIGFGSLSEKLEVYMKVFDFKGTGEFHLESIKQFLLFMTSKFTESEKRQKTLNTTTSSYSSISKKNSVDYLIQIFNKSEETLSKQDLWSRLMYDDNGKELVRFIDDYFTQNIPAVNFDIQENSRKIRFLRINEQENLMEIKLRTSEVIAFDTMNSFIEENDLLEKYNPKKERKTKMQHHSALAIKRITPSAVFISEKPFNSANNILKGKLGKFMREDYLSEEEEANNFKDLEMNCQFISNIERIETCQTGEREEGSNLLSKLQGMNLIDSDCSNSSGDEEDLYNCDIDEVAEKLNYKENFQKHDDVVTLENYIYFMESNHLELKYVILIKDMLYIYLNNNKEDNNYNSRYLFGSFIKQGTNSVQISGSIYFTFSIHFQSGKIETFFFKDKEMYTTWLQEIQKVCKIRDFFASYSLKEEIGKGGFGKIFSAKNLESGEEVAVKILDKVRESRNSWIAIKSEIDNLRVLYHPKIVNYIDSYENSNYVFIIMEYLKFTKLSTIIRENKYNQENVICQIAYQLALAIEYLHGLNIIHCDIKPDNILVLKSNDGEFEVKLIDMGSAKIQIQGEIVRDGSRTLKYSAPEILEGKQFSKEVDIWSFGITLLKLTTGEFPFREGLTEQETKLNICKKDFTFPDKLQKFSEQLKALIFKCLSKNPKKRPTIEEILSNPWFSDVRKP